MKYQNRGVIFYEEIYNYHLSVYHCSGYSAAVYAATYVGNRNSWKFHYQGCQWERKMNESNRIYFSSRQEAIDRGMAPCKVCHP